MTYRIARRMGRAARRIQPFNANGALLRPSAPSFQADPCRVTAWGGGVRPVGPRAACGPSGRAERVPNRSFFIESKG
jgi:hypothetical protein